ncbi:cupin domain-containing protein [Glutamicibacter sp.]|uniref:cupin domain-containing protein n=1 Tax=Glutamicibacter sp. TaxID=1931995 RepID=UPI003D6B44C3
MAGKILQASIVQADAVELMHEAADGEQLAAGHVPATTGYRALGTLGEAEVGIWEMSAGAMQDVEADEYFAVLAGSATVQILEADGFGAQELVLVPGSVVRLHAGMKTRWTVTKTLRKIYFTL